MPPIWTQQTKLDIQLRYSSYKEIWLLYSGYKDIPAMKIIQLRYSSYEKLFFFEEDIPVMIFELWRYSATIFRPWRSLAMMFRLWRYSDMIDFQLWRYSATIFQLRRQSDTIFQLRYPAMIFQLCVRVPGLPAPACLCKVKNENQRCDVEDVFYKACWSKWTGQRSVQRNRWGSWRLPWTYRNERVDINPRATPFRASVRETNPVRLESWLAAALAPHLISY